MGQKSKPAGSMCNKGQWCSLIALETKKLGVCLCLNHVAHKIVSQYHTKFGVCIHWLLIISKNNMLDRYMSQLLWWSCLPTPWLLANGYTFRNFLSVETVERTRDWLHWWVVCNVIDWILITNCFVLFFIQLSLQMKLYFLIDPYTMTGRERCRLCPRALYPYPFMAGYKHGCANLA